MQADGLTVKLFKPNRIYNGGEDIEGLVVVNVSGELKFRGIRLEVKGKCLVHFYSPTVGTDNNHSADETYFDEILYIAGRSNDVQGEDIVLRSGKYEYPFKYHLPLDSPSTMETSFGYVRYSINAVMDIPRNLDLKHKTSFRVINPLDLNYEVLPKSPQTVEGSKAVSSWCCSAGTITATFTVGKLGYVPGDNIVVYGEVTNNSSKSIRRTTAKLIGKITYSTYLRSMYQEKDVAKVSRGRVPPGGVDVWNGELIQVPDVPPSGMRGCSKINIVNKLIFIVEMAGPGSDMVLTLDNDIIIGTIPLDN